MFTGYFVSRRVFRRTTQPMNGLPAAEHVSAVNRLALANLLAGLLACANLVSMKPCLNCRDLEYMYDRSINHFISLAHTSADWRSNCRPDLGSISTARRQFA